MTHGSQRHFIIYSLFSIRMIKSTKISHDEAGRASMTLCSVYKSEQVDFAEILEQTSIKSNGHNCPDIQHIKTNSTPEQKQTSNFQDHRIS